MESAFYEFIFYTKFMAIPQEACDSSVLLEDFRQILDPTIKEFSVNLPNFFHFV